MKKFVLSAALLMLSAFAAFAGMPGPQLVPDYNRDGKIDEIDYGRMEAGEAFTVWLNDDDDAEGTADGETAGDTNVDLHDVPGGEGNDKDCEDEKVNGRCDLLDFFPVLVDVSGVPEWDGYTWKLSSKSVNVVFTGLRADTAGDFHTKDAKDFDGETSLYQASVKKLAGEDDEDAGLLEDGFLVEGRGVFLIEGAALGDEGLTLRGEKNGSAPVEVTLSLRVVKVEDMYGWMNLRGSKPSTLNPQISNPKSQISNLKSQSSNLKSQRHFVLVHGYNTNHEEARGNAAEFYKKLWQSGSDAMFTAVEWKGDQSQVRFDLLGVTFSPNYFVNVENAFAAARPFAEACKKLPGEKILVGHSLGNVLISSAIKDYGLDYTKYVMLNAAVAREAFDESAYDMDMIDEDWLGDEVKVKGEGEGEGAGGGEGEGGGSLTNHLDWASRWYRNFADRKYDPYEYRRKLAWRGRFANLPRTVNYYSQSDNILVNPDPNEKDPDELFARDDQEIGPKVRELLLQKLISGKSIGRDGRKRTGFGFWAFSEKMKGTWVIDAINDVLTNTLDVAQADAMKCEGGWGENEAYDDDPEKPFDPANTRFTPFLDERLKERGMLDILPAETERVRAQHLADAIPAESFAAGANEIATLENVNLEDFIGENNEDWPLYEGGDGDGTKTNLWNHSAFREVAFYHTSKFYASIAATGKPRVIIDTDLGSSMDDLFTVDFAARMHHAGKLDLMAVMMNRPDKSDAAEEGEFLKFADRYLGSLGLGDLPIGTSTPLTPDRIPQHVFNPYWTFIYSNNLSGVGLMLPTNRTDAQIGALTNAVALYRRLLEDAQPKSVVICSLGFLNNLKALMDSEADYEGDGIGSTGLELIAAKVKELRIMAGCFNPDTAPDGKNGAEYNAAGDPAGTKKVFEEWPTPVVVSTWEVGLKLWYDPKDVLADFPPGTFNPVVRAAYTNWPDEELNVKNRLWDVMTVLPLTEGETLAPLSEMGGISVDTNGVTTFTADASSNRCYQVAANMNATTVMNRFREICRTGNPSLPEAVRCIKDAGVDYNGHDLTFKVPKFSLGAYGSNEVHMAFAFGDKSYVPDEVTYDPVLEVFSVHFTVPKEDATAGNVYNGALTIALENDAIGRNVVKEVPTQLVQGRQEQAEPVTDWFNETNLEAPTNYVPAKVGRGDMPERCLATVETTFLFEAPVEATDEPPEGAAQGAVRIVADGADGYKFQYYACVGKTNEDSFVRGWWDFNVGGEDVGEIKPVLDREYTVRAEAYYFEDARGEENTLVIWVEELGSNRGPVKQFIGNIINENGGQGGTTRLHSIEFRGDGEISSLVGNYYTNTVNATLARVGVGEGADATREYRTVAEAVAAAKGSPIRLLHAASWKPTEADLGQPVKFLNKSCLVLDDSELPFGMRPVWSDVDGNNGTLMLAHLYGGLKKIVPYLHEIWYDGYVDSSLTGEDAPFGDLPVKGLGGCSSVRVGNFHGRNLDIAVSDLASIVIHMAATSNRFASVGTTQWFDVSETALSTNGVSAHRFDVLPNWMLDGINESGVAINVNIIPMDVPQDGDDPESDDRPALHARKVARYVLDHAESAAGVVEQLKGFRIFGNIGAAENNIHWMISDAEKTFVVEVIKGEVVAREHPIMTNFNINWDNGKQRAIDPSEYENWGPEKYFWAAAYSNDTDTIFETYTLHAEGIERYIRLRDNRDGYLKRGATFEGMVDLMRETQYSKIAYLPLAETYLSDLLDMQEVKDAGFKSLEDIYAASNAVKLAVMWEELRPKMTNVYENLAAYRNPDKMVPYSITTHNVTFDLVRKMFRIVVQEEYDEPFDFWLVESVPVTPGEPIVCDTAEAATNAAKKAVLTPTPEVEAKLGKGSDALRTYCDRFGFLVAPTSDGKWAVEAALYPEDWTNVVESAREATLQIPVADLASMTEDGKKDVKVDGCVPGFYYSLYGAAGVRALSMTETVYGPELSGVSGEVTFPEVKKPSDVAGFFTIGVLDAPTVYVAGANHTITATPSVFPPGHHRQR